MTINNYTVGMNAQYFKLEKESLVTSIKKENESFSSQSSQDVNKVLPTLLQTNSDDSELAMELSKAILKNIVDEGKTSFENGGQMSYSYEESQSLNYQVKAFIQTDDRSIELSLDVSLARSFTVKTQITFEDIKKLQDPLVISLEGGMPSLSSQTFLFDIDSDGESEQVSQLNSGNGFLALDKNENAKIDDGSELFGASSGNGFKDLAKYDDDKNGWIDESDAIFDKLRIWQKSEGKDKLIGLGEVGIGAIFLGNIETPFSLKSETNELLGEMRKSSFVLYENGSANVISQIDLAISPKTTEGINTLADANKGASRFNLNDTYKKANEEVHTDKGSSSQRIKIIKEKIKELESKLLGANEGKRASIEGKISTLLSQMMSLLEVA